MTFEDFAGVSVDAREVALGLMLALNFQAKLETISKMRIRTLFVMFILIFLLFHFTSRTCIIIHVSNVRSY